MAGAESPELGADRCAVGSSGLGEPVTEATGRRVDADLAAGLGVDEGQLADVGQRVLARVADLDGKQLVETPEWTYAARMDLAVTDDLDIGLQAKKVGDRYSTDLNDEIAPGYTVVDVDLNWGFQLPGFERAEFQFNVTNLLDEEYFGNISSGAGGTSVGFFSIGAPRTVVASLRFDF